MPSTDERLTALETSEKAIYKELDEIKQEQKDQRQLIVVVEQIATKTNLIADKVNKIDERITEVEKEPARQFKKYKETIITSIITLIIGAIVGGLIALILK